MAGFEFDPVSYLMGRNSGGGGGGGGGGTPVQRNAVNFTDYDGTVLYSYTAAAFNSLSEMPENPTHSGLVAQGWNWSLSDAKAYVASHGGLDICQRYNTSDGKTRIYVSLPDNRLSLSVRFGVNGTAVIDWGDGTSDSTLSGMNISTMQSANHTYARAGNYVIKVAVTGTIRVFGQNGSSRLLFGTSGNQAVDMIYVTLIQKIEFGSGVELGTYAIAYCRSLKSIMMPDSMTASSADHMMANCNSLKSITIPSGMTSIYDDAFSGCSSLESVLIPNTVTSIGMYAFQSCYSLSSVMLPDSVTSVGTYAFNACNSLTQFVISGGMTSIPDYMLYECLMLGEVTVPVGITSIGQYAFGRCATMYAIHFKGNTPPTVTASNAFANVPADCVIYVPSGKLSTYTSATNYPSSATYTYTEE